MKNRRLYLPAAMLLCLLLTGYLFADGSKGEKLLREWFSESRKSSSYESIEDELYTLFRDIADTGIPPELLIEKLREGAAKRIPAGRLLSALQEELERLIIAGKILSGSGYSSGGAQETYSAYKIIAIMLREEIAEDTISELLREAKSLDLPLSAGAAACSAVFQAASVTDLSGGDLLRLGISLYKSTLGPSNYGAVASLFVKGRVNRLDEREILGIIENVFTRGGGLIRLERELNKRTRR